MPVTPTYPGIYLEEVPSEVRTIPLVGTSAAAFIGFFARGPLNAPVRVLSLADFQRDFGGLHRDSVASYGVQQCFLNSGTEAHLVRVCRGAFRTASVIVGSIAAGPQYFRAFAGRRIRGESVRNPGQWGNMLRIEIDYKTAAPDEVFSGVEATTIERRELFNLTVAEVAYEAGRMSVVNTEEYANLTMRPGVSRNAIEVVNGGSRLIQLDRAGMAALPAPFVGTFRPPATGTLGVALAAPIPPDLTTFQVSYAAVTRTCTLNYGGAAPTTFPGLRRFVQAAIRAQGSATSDPLLAQAVVELVGDGTVAAPHRFRVLAGRSGRNFDPETRLAFGGAGAPALGLTAAGNVQQYSLGATASVGAQVVDPVAGLGQGADGDVPDATVLRGVEANKTGLYALEDVDLFNILCIPAAAELPAAQMRAVYSEAAQYCARRRAFLIVDIPQDVDSVEEMETWTSDNANLRHQNAAVYFPRVRVADPLDEYRLRSLAASGTIAGLYARTDVARGVWKAPGGTEATLSNVGELAYKLTDPENGVLNPLGVNCLRSFPVYGNVCWGARTLVGADAQASQWKYIPVRRFALFLEESLYRGTQWVVFEPNDEPLWAQIRLNIGAAMHSLFRKGAFQGRSPREAYLVKCDAETTTQDDINRGIVNILVGFAPLKPAEFVIIKIQQLAGQIQA